MNSVQFILLLITLISSTMSAQSVLDTYRRLTDEERFSIRQEKINRFLLPAMQTNKIDMWITLTREYVQDPVANDLGAGSPTARAALIFTDNGDKLGRTAIMASYDVDAPKNSGIYDTVISYRSEGLLPHLRDFIAQRKPKTIGVNFSKDTPLADGLTVSMWNYLKEAAGPEYSDNKVVSAEPVIVAWRGKKLPREIEILRVAVKATEEIIAQAFSPKVIKPGKTTELDVARYVKDLMKKMNVTESWEPSGCPSINTGVSRGHSEPGDAVIQPGHVLTIDFGINLDGYCTDIQRTVYVLKPGEKQPPAHIRKMWETNVKAVEAGFAQMHPGKTGNDVDNACRKVITDAGYNEYPHGAGHPIGYITHEVGPLLGPDWPERYGKKVFLTLEPGQVFALEPAVSAPSLSEQQGRAGKELGGDIRTGIEEDVLITEKGPEWLSTPQKQLILIPSH
jgi:Xaa-Pro aminopeptidase